MQGLELGIAQAHGSFPETQLGQAGAGPDQNGEGSRGDLGIEPAVIARTDGVEFLAPVGDHAGEHVDAARGAFGVGRRRQVVRQSQTFLQFGDIDAARFEDRTC